MRPFIRAAVFAAAALAAGSASAFAQAAAPPFSSSDCQTCHENAVTTVFSRTAHATLEQQCESCHNGAAAHLKGQSAGENTPGPSLKKMNQRAQDGVCLTCHETGARTNWAGGTHDRRGTGCTTCHSVHTPESRSAQLKTARASESCYACHKTERAKSKRTSHHPVREGKMECSSCHNPHDGSRPSMLKAESINDLCYSCHAEKRGPFLYEHAAVREDCISCHEPHGTNHKRLLLAKLPNLCWNCHLSGSGHFGSGDNHSTEDGAYTIAPAGAPSGFPTVNSRFVEKSCKNCHVNLHGSNSPSGAFFLR